MSEQQNPRLDPPGSRDWIVAPATAAGSGAIAVVRLDGPGCWRAASKVWRVSSRSDELPASPLARRLTLGRLVDESGAEIDEAMVAFFPAPHSYTRNDLVEFQCHGSPAVVSALIDALLAAGARMARPGEFTLRAFFNGRIDLAQAEGVANLIASRTRKAGRAALRQIEGGLSEEVLSLRDRAIDLAAEIEARLDFPDEEIPPADRKKMLDAFESLETGIERLIATARKGRLLRDGARVAIAGKPNTGKSSLFNALLGIERALVTPRPGTTRDTIEATLDIRGIPVVLIDTAGVRSEGTGEIERLGIERTLREVEGADLVLFVADASRRPDDEDRKSLDALGSTRRIVVLNKNDLPPASDAAEGFSGLFSPSRDSSDRETETPVVRVSALQHATLQPLETALERSLTGTGEEASEREGTIVTNLRHEERLHVAIEGIRRAHDAFARRESGECAMIDLNEALDSLGAILGLTLDDAVLSRVFNRFCIGK
ncbi:tRNA uridine-5-carboxymethylaminomethyl(34) synthesis GTPase MnmE [Candidatus Sumerlaeota bacterium]|nr:tRNA uridine-5-carboxymethylaminomethyl(34) synthesis GTPase MnmE [Candidatus Sumerlaeota bacterium]